MKRNSLDFKCDSYFHNHGLFSPGRESVAIWKKSIPAFHFSPWAETNEEIEYKRARNGRGEREKTKQTRRLLYCWFVRLPGATQSSLVRSPASGTSDDVHHLLTSRQVSKLFSRARICGRYTDCFTQPPPHTHLHAHCTRTRIHSYTNTRLN